MGSKKTKNKTPQSIFQRVKNQTAVRGLRPEDGLTLYAMDRLLYRLGRSRHRKEFSLKGGVLASHLMKLHSRHTRDIDLERRHGPPDPEAHRVMFEDIIAISIDDGLEFSRVQAQLATHDSDGYDGIVIKIQGRLYNTSLEVKIDIGLGDAVRPPPGQVQLTPFLESDQPPLLLAYGPEPFVAEKVETILGKYPLIQHRLKDVYDVVRLSRFHAFEEAVLSGSLQATFTRRDFELDPEIFAQMRRGMLKGRQKRKWETDWAKMLNDKRCPEMSLLEALEGFESFVQPLLEAMEEEDIRQRRWPAGGPWLEEDE
ncbi:MAG: hypothetical protein ACI8RZ_006054 [Myxococcota bacterium]|jgi:hypothetical protein